MEGVGARLGRSSTRYAPTTVFNGPVRKWKKRWVHVSPSPSSSSAAATTTATIHHPHSHNRTANGNNGSRILLYKWTPISQSISTNSNANNVDDVDAHASEEPPRRRFKFVPIIVLEEQKNEAAEKTDDEAKPSDVDPIEGEPTSISNSYDGKPDINDVPMEDSQAPDDAQLVRQDLNESTLDLSLGLKARDGDHNSDSKSDQTKHGQLERANSSSMRT